MNNKEAGTTCFEVRILREKTVDYYEMIQERNYGSDVRLRL